MIKSKGPIIRKKEWGTLQKKRALSRDGLGNHEKGKDESLVLPKLTK